MDVDHNAKIADFGVSALSTEDKDIMKDTKGTYFFMAPEVLDKTKAAKGYSGRLADVWSLGVTLWTFCYLELPFIGIGEEVNEMTAMEIAQHI